MYDSVVDNAFCANIATDIISLEITYLDSLDRCMDEFEVAGLVVCGNHYSYVTYVFATAPGGEEYEISLAEILAVDRSTLEILGT